MEDDVQGISSGACMIVIAVIAGIGAIGLIVFMAIIITLVVLRWRK